MITVPPSLTVLCWIALEHFESSLFRALTKLQALGPSSFTNQFAPTHDWRVTVAYFGWVLFQALLYTVLPGKSTGQLTAGGRLLDYSTNGFLAWVTSVLAFAVLALSGIIDPSFIARHWGSLIITLNIYGYALSVVAYLKAYYAPSHLEDLAFSGSMLYDFLMGIELNPRFGQHWDWKLFHNGRPGIIGWTLIDLTYAALQYQTHGTITNSMLIINLLHGIYVADFFINEDWYLRTIDICHEYFGFYLAWGSAVWLPSIYTLQAQYLARNPVDLSPLAATTILTLGLGGYVFFRLANRQKDRVRKSKGDCYVWGAKAKVMRCHFKTINGQKHETLLLLSGWWGIARHFNYVGDLILSFSMCALCGTRDLLPWAYAIFMACILIHRCYRVDQRCRVKYGAQWDEYCSLVRWNMVPGIW
ncbi:ERG4/ERG24 ergosterol biosynthesis protein [Thozetella sp. PMI_491]|nr:ERG4/ERG24 ergosterol biosynthesis protein [Thozetella sp. PMI_491]